MTSTYDSRCYDLAELFLLEIAGSTENDLIELAVEIQRVCEEACAEVEAREAGDAVEKGKFAQDD